MLVKDVIKMLKEFDKNQEIMFDSHIDRGRGYTGDSDCSVSIYTEDNVVIFHTSGDEDSDTGYYD